MVTLQILVLSFQVRILVAQQRTEVKRFGFFLYSISKVAGLLIATVFLFDCSFDAYGKVIHNRKNKPLPFPKGGDRGEGMQI